MPLTSFLFGQTKKRTQITPPESIKNSSNSAGLALDATVRIVPTRSYTITKNPIEDGSDITDNTRKQNLSLQISGWVSDSPLGFAASLGGAIAGFTGAQVGQQSGGAAGAAFTATVGTLAALATNRLEDDIQFPDKAREYLEQIADAREPFTIVTNLKSYPDMVIATLSFPQDATSGRSLMIEMTCEQVQIVESEFVAGVESAINEAVSHTAAAKATKGAQGAAQAGDQTTSNGSLIRQGYDSFRTPKAGAQ